MHVLAFLLVAPLTAESLDMATRSRSFFETIIDFHIKDGRLVIQSTGTDESVHASFQTFNDTFSMVGLRSYSTPRIGGSGRMEGVGLAFVIFQPDGHSGRFEFRLTTPGETETVELIQYQPGILRYSYETFQEKTLFVQNRKAVSLVVKSRYGLESFHANDFSELIEKHREKIRLHLAIPLERYFDSVPVSRKDSPGGEEWFFIMESGERIVGKLTGEIMQLRQVDGLLALPFSSIRKILREASAHRVITGTGEYTGMLEEKNFFVETRYGRIRIESKDVVRLLRKPQG